MALKTNHHITFACYGCVISLLHPFGDLGENNRIQINEQWRIWFMWGDDGLSYNRMRHVHDCKVL